MIKSFCKHTQTNERTKNAYDTKLLTTIGSALCAPTFSDYGFEKIYIVFFVCMFRTYLIYIFILNIEIGLIFIISSIDISFDLGFVCSK